MENRRAMPRRPDGPHRRRAARFCPDPATVRGSSAQRLRQDRFRPPCCSHRKPSYRADARRPRSGAPASRISAFLAALDTESASDAAAKMAEAPTEAIVIAIQITAIFVPTLGAIEDIRISLEHVGVPAAAGLSKVGRGNA